MGQGRGRERWGCQRWRWRESVDGWEGNRKTEKAIWNECLDSSKVDGGRESEDNWYGWQVLALWRSKPYANLYSEECHQLGLWCIRILPACTMKVRKTSLSCQCPNGSIIAPSLAPFHFNIYIFKLKSILNKILFKKNWIISQISQFLLCSSEVP